MVFNLRNKIIEIQNGNKNNIYDILIIFDNILNKYSRLLDHEDTKQDLIIFLIGLLDKIPIYEFNNERQILSYISKSIKYEYIRLSKINSRKLSNEVYINEDTEMYYNFDSSDIEFLDLISVLNESEKNILKLFFIENFSISEISKLMNVSRQAINQNKNRAIKKLKYIVDDYIYA
ncbi:sigma-70 family RNA polymerase sigma factor [Clostridium sp. NSJ-6]|uniref:Sigma-70 family RNA polymerase sigma factor n=1 Tax=Clostridium hominis TaxID=2763036 RepID=A0ABR7DGF7_9CLOT|nr:sigma-70 family RNA polymerase sigma factor [Clostridium hominis]MBC5630511.1 sigma-70 family RNA polymerase sigma factor [Clostridium hominis]